MQYKIEPNGKPNIQPRESDLSNGKNLKIPKKSIQAVNGTLRPNKKPITKFMFNITQYLGFSKNSSDCFFFIL